MNARDGGSRSPLRTRGSGSAPHGRSPSCAGTTWVANGVAVRFLIRAPNTSAGVARTSSRDRSAGAYGPDQVGWLTAFRWVDDEWNSSQPRDSECLPSAVYNITRRL